MPDQEREKYLKEISSLHAENATLKEEIALMPRKSIFKNYQQRNGYFDEQCNKKSFQ